MVQTAPNPSTDKRHDKATEAPSRKAPSRKLLTIELSCKDEARVGQKGTHAYLWAAVGSRPLMVRDPDSQITADIRLLAGGILQKDSGSPAAESAPRPAASVGRRRAMPSLLRWHSAG